MSVFITFEGGDGSGKSTQATLLSSFLEKQGFDILFTHEPGGTTYGEMFRNLLLDFPKLKDFDLDARAQVLGFCSARAQLVSEKILPRLKKTNTVTISDRFADSTIAYQVFGGEILDLKEDIEKILEFATYGLKPHLTIFLDISPQIGAKRREGRIKKEEEPHTFIEAQQLSFLDSNHFDEKKLNFHKAVRDGYLSLISQEPDRWWSIDGNRSIEVIQKEIQERIVEWLGVKGIHPKTEKTRKPKDTSKKDQGFFLINTNQENASFAK